MCFPEGEVLNSQHAMLNLGQICQLKIVTHCSDCVYICIYIVIACELLRHCGEKTWRHIFFYCTPLSYEEKISVMMFCAKFEVFGNNALIT